MDDKPKYTIHLIQHAINKLASTQSSSIGSTVNAVGGGGLNIELLSPDHI
jgi:hypothetical protein